jgi:hypothetical protein
VTKVATLIASRNRPDLVDSLVAQLRRHASIENDIYVVECGSDPAKLSEHSTLWYADEPFRGKCYGHNLALQSALLADDYDYVFVLMNDLVFPEEVDPVATLVAQLEAEPRLACLSPTEPDSHYPAGRPQPGGGWRTVTTSDYLALMMRVEAIREVGFLDAAFTYCWGAIHELSYKLYARGWKLGYSDAVSYVHLGGSTYGAAGTNTISRDEYQVQAREFAARYFRETYGERWDELFWDAAQWAEPETNTYALHRGLWEGAPAPKPAAAPFVFRRPTALGAPPDFVGVGAMKASTTRWFALLGAHPGVHCPDPWRKELHFFDDRPDGFDPGEYYALFARPQGLLAGEWTPSYMFLEHVPAQLAQAAPNAKLLAILRDPVDRYRSGITHSAERWGMLNDGWLRMHREIGFYARQLRRLYDWFPREQVLVLQHERCAVDARGELAKTFRFLGLDDGFVPEQIDEVIHPGAAEKLPLPQSARVALAEAYAEDVLELARLVPGLDLSLWPSFAVAVAA